MDSLFFIDFNSINFNIEFLFKKYYYIIYYINYDNYLYFLNKNYILYNLLILVLILYPLISKYYLLNTLKYLINNIYLLIQKKELDFYYINEHLLYSLFFWVKKKSFIRLTFRLFEVQKDNKEKYKYRKLYFLLQYIDYFYFKIILDYFYSLLLRIIYFIFIFIVKNTIYFLQFIILRVLCKFKIYNIFFYNIFCIFMYIINKSKNIIYNIFTFINYIKLEIFIYINNENNFFGGFFMYLYNSFYYKIPIFNNFKNWQLYKLPNSKFINNIFYNWIKYTKFINNFIIPYNKKYIISHIFKLLKIFILYFIYIYKINIFNNLNISNLYIYKKKIKEYNYMYIVLGSIYYFFFDLFKNIICYIIFLIYYIIIKFRYIIIIYLLYKLGLIYIFYISFIYYLTYYVEDNIFILLLQSISTIYDFYDIIIDRNILIDSNEGLCNTWKDKYEELVIKKKFYKYHTLIGKLTLLSLRNINLNSFNLTSLYDSTKILKSSVLMYTWKKFFNNIFYVIYMEITTYLKLKYYIYIYNHINIYNTYLLYISDINIIYYLIKKLYLIFIIFKIYLLMYLKYIYFYIVPYYFMLSIVLKIYFIYFYLWNIYIIIYSNIISLYYNLFLIFLLYLSKFLLYVSIIFLNFKVIILFIYIDIIFLYTLLNKVFNIIQLNISLNLYNIYINLLIDKLIYLNKFKEILINYFRLNIYNLINYKYNSSNILGNKVIAHTQFNLEELDFIKLRKSGLNKAQMEEALIQDKLYKRYTDFFSYTNRLYIFNNLYYLYINYFTNNLYWDWLYVKNFWIFNMYIKNIIFYFIIDIYILFYLILFFLCKKFLNINIFKANNVEYLWYDLKKNLDYKVLNNNKYFMKALYYHQKIHGKIKLSNNIYKFLDLNWKNLYINKFSNKLFNFNIGLKNPYFYNRTVYHNSLKNYKIEKNMYYNNFFQFYWKNLIMFNSFNNNNNFIENYEDSKNYNILNFFLSLVFNKYRNSSQIFFFFENSNKNFYWNKNYNKFFYKVHNKLTLYFLNIENWLNLYSNNSLLHKDSSLILFKDEDKNFSDMYSLNFNVNIPKYLFEFFWIVFIMYILILKFRNKFVHMYDLYSTYVRITYLKMLLINNNFMYLYDILIYWFNYIFMFDIKNMGYEQHDFKHHLSKTNRYYRRIRPSNLFIINNDPLYSLKKNYSYHLRYYNINYNVILNSFSIIYINYTKFWLNLIIFIVCYKNLYINYNNNININIIIDIINIYNNNVLKYYNFLLKNIYKNII